MDRLNNTGDNVGAGAVAASAATTRGRNLQLHNQAQVDEALALLASSAIDSEQVPA